MRKLIALLLALALLCPCIAFAEADVAAADATDQTAADGEAAVAEEVVLTPAEIALLGRPVSEEPTHVTVGNTTKVSGSFFTGMWSNNTSDIDVRNMLHGYCPVEWFSLVVFVPN